MTELLNNIMNKQNEINSKLETIAVEFDLLKKETLALKDNDNSILTLMDEVEKKSLKLIELESTINSISEKVNKRIDKILTKIDDFSKKINQIELKNKEIKTTDNDCIIHCVNY